MSDQDPHQADDGSALPPPEPAPTTSVIQAVSRQNWTRGLIAFAVALVVLVALGFGAARINELLTRSPAEVALDRIQAESDAQTATTVLTTGGTAAVEWSDSLGTAVFHSDDLPAIDDDEQFALWFQRASSSVLAGAFDAAHGEAAVELDGPITEGDLIALTVEPAGEPPASPSGEPLVEIPTS